MDKETLPRTFTLNNGLTIPAVGFGTHTLFDKESIVRGVVEAGYRHIDTAHLYENEGNIGEAITECISKGVKREELFITTKIWHTQYNDVEAACRESCRKLEVDYLDLYIVHWPHMYYAEPKKAAHALWADMEALVDKGLCKSIGVSNYNTQMIWDMLCYARIKPAVNQIELNPQCAQWELVRFLLAKDILPIAFTPVARPGAVEKGDTLTPPDWPDLRDNEYLQSLAAKYNKSVPQVMLNWGLCRGYAVIPKAASAKYQLENLDIFDFRLTEEEIVEAGKLDASVRLCNKFPFNESFDVFA